MSELTENSQASHRSIIEALLIAVDSPLPMVKIMEITNLPEEDIRRLIEELNHQYRQTKRSFEIKEIAGGFQIYTLPEYALWVGALHDRKSKLSRAALETLAIIAYHQPITRAEIEKLRGVDSTYMLEILLQKNLVRTCGRLPIPGRPIKYGTTREFLRYFGIKDLSEMPREEDFAVNIQSSEEPTAAGSEPVSEAEAESDAEPAAEKTPGDRELDEDIEGNDTDFDEPMIDADQEKKETVDEDTDLDNEDFGN